MMEAESGRTYDFDTEWVRKAGWAVVPVEDTCHFAPIEVETICRVLRSANYQECLAIASEPVDPAPSCYRLPITKEGLLAFNRECGPFRYVLTDENRLWAISCNEWYNLFAAKRELLEALLGQTIEEARQEFVEFASLMGKGNTDEPLMQVARHYADL
jgi:hypothetical protein